MPDAAPGRGGSDVALKFACKQPMRSVADPQGSALVHDAVACDLDRNDGAGSYVSSPVGDSLHLILARPNRLRPDPDASIRAFQKAHNLWNGLGPCLELPFAFGQKKDVLVVGDPFGSL